MSNPEPSSSATTDDAQIKSEIPEGKSSLDENELSDLLKNTFQDFCEIYNTSINSTSATTSSLIKGDPKSKTTNDNKSDKDSNQSNSIDSTNYKSNFVPLYDADSELKENCSRLAKSCNEPIDTDLRENLLSTLNFISERAKNISENNDDSFTEKEFAQMLSNLQDGGAESAKNIQDGMFEFNKILPLMSNIMENLLSKDFLYPTLAELNTKYPTYLEENKESLPKDEYDRFENQFKIIQQICKEFEDEKEDDSSDIKKQRFQKIIVLMQQMQSYGAPPMALVDSKEKSDTSVLDQLNSLKPDQMSQCTIT